MFSGLFEKIEKEILAEQRVFSEMLVESRNRLGLRVDAEIRPCDERAKVLVLKEYYRNKGETKTMNVNRSSDMNTISKSNNN